MASEIRGALGAAPKGFSGLPSWGLMHRDMVPLHHVSRCSVREVGVLGLLGTSCSLPPFSSFLAILPSPPLPFLPSLFLHSLPLLPVSAGFLSSAFHSSLEVKCAAKASALKAWSPTRGSEVGFGKVAGSRSSSMESSTDGLVSQWTPWKWWELGSGVWLERWASVIP